MLQLVRFLEGFIRLENTGFKLIFDRKDIKDQIIYLNTQEQLYNKGIKNDGSPITPEYTDFTKGLKAVDGDPYDRVTLKQDGNFYKTFKVTVNQDDFEITADGQKDDNNLFDKYGEEVIGLTNESFEALRPLVHNAVRELLNKL